MNCGCDNKKQFPTIKEKSSRLDSKDELVVATPLCPHCLGSINGCLDKRLPKNTEKVISPPLEIQLKDNHFKRSYEEGYKNSRRDDRYEQTSEHHYRFHVKKNEFGESYHIAAAMLSNCNLDADLTEASRRQQYFFYSIFNQSRINKLRPSIATNESTGFISQYFESRDGGEDGYEGLFQKLLVNFIEPGEQEENLKTQFSEYLISLGLTDKESDKAIIWIRRQLGSENRNLTLSTLLRLVDEIKRQKIQHIILAGDCLAEGEKVSLFSKQEVTFYDLTQFHLRPGFQLMVGNHETAGQLFLFKRLQDDFKARFAIGMKSGAMDGPAFCGLPTLNFLDESSNRIKKAAETIKTIIPLPYESENKIEEVIDSIEFGSSISKILGRPYEYKALDGKSASFFNLAKSVKKASRERAISLNRPLG